MTPIDDPIYKNTIYTFLATALRWDVLVYISIFYRVFKS